MGKISLKLRERVLLSVALVGLSAGFLWAQIPAGPLAHWKLDETGANTTAADSSGNAHNGTVANPTWTAGRIGGALSFDGANSVRVSGATVLEGPSYAISAWVKYTQTDTSGGDVVSMGDNYGLRVQPDGSVKTYFYAGTSIGYRMAVSTGVNTKDGQWHHIVGQYGGGALQVYVDGVKRGDVPYSNPVVYAQGADMYLGRHGNGGTNHDFFGSIDQVRVYGRALTSADVMALLAEGGAATKVLTWNLRKGRATDNSDSIATFAVADWIKNTAQADILLLSAVENDLEAKSIQDRLNSGGGTWDRYWKKSSNASEGQAILSRYPMPSANGERAFHEVSCPNATENQVIVKAVVTVNGSPINVFAVDQQDGSSAGSVRQCQAQDFITWAGQFSQPRIIAGDFNSVPTDAGITTWTSSGYSDAWANAVSKIGYPQEGSSIGNDLNSAIFGRTKKNRIDYILTSPRMTVTEGRVWLTRKAGTTCNSVTSDSFIDTTAPCGGDCSTCKYVDDKGVRPSDHIPVTAIIQLQ
jgi:endonuclease/exonuclease/phosphatase family metal-dependent hydrolase